MTTVYDLKVRDLLAKRRAIWDSFITSDSPDDRAVFEKLEALRLEFDALLESDPRYLEAFKREVLRQVWRSTTDGLEEGGSHM